MLIYKEELPMDTADIRMLSLPFENEGDAVKNILHIDIQNSRPYMWYNTDTNKEEKEFALIAVGTGHKWNDDIVNINNYIGTVTIGLYVFHYFIVENFREKFNNMGKI